MNTASDSSEVAAVIYIRLIRQDNSEAADTIEQIQTIFGPHAALRTALIITIMKMEVQQNHWMPYKGLYLHLLNAYPDAIPLATYAMNCCLQGWVTRDVADERWETLPIVGN